MDMTRFTGLRSGSSGQRDLHVPAGAMDRVGATEAAAWAVRTGHLPSVEVPRAEPVPAADTAVPAFRAGAGDMTWRGRESGTHSARLHDEGSARLHASPHRYPADWAESTSRAAARARDSMQRAVQHAIDDAAADAVDEARATAYRARASARSRQQSRKGDALWSTVGPDTEPALRERTRPRAAAAASASYADSARQQRNVAGMSTTAAWAGELRRYSRIKSAQPTSATRKRSSTGRKHKVRRLPAAQHQPRASSSRRAQQEAAQLDVLPDSASVAANRAALMDAVQSMSPDAMHALLSRRVQSERPSSRYPARQAGAGPRSTARRAAPSRRVAGEFARAGSVLEGWSVDSLDHAPLPGLPASTATSADTHLDAAINTALQRISEQAKLAASATARRK